MKLLFNTILLITAFFLDSVLCAVAGNNAYRVTKEPSRFGGDTISVFTSGYENGREAVLVTRMDVKGRKISVAMAYNARDKTPNRLHLDVMLKSLWQTEGGQLHNLESKAGTNCLKPLSERSRGGWQMKVVILSTNLRC
ncbi:uncharacterized protein LY79DRAFT_551257 [Colletotrichum navitas]|uniref:Uncharacterized protein n=1 Tax=Colletotrichum navitas TaxID=681940 RepID=A0AAD8Q0Y6_9PEZI|nr:uncharacterized protein LY79DRAFT_551257 [Colletotrichum navitas]KAK1593563.1 hypothetical protein LY79DRAFT_551257 [Colletotrichum navitas]